MVRRLYSEPILPTMAYPSQFLLSIALVVLSVTCAQRADSQIYADFETSKGNFTIEMLYEDQPMAVANFIGLADGSITWLDFDTLELRRGIPFYNGIKFHRVIKDFMIQGGSPNGMGTDNPGYSWIDQFARNADGSLKHPHDKQGQLSMANSGLNTNGSQFFITDVATPWLDGKHVVFGNLAGGPFGSREEGLAVITAMNDTPTDDSDRPIEDLVIHKITIRRVGEAANAFDVHAQGLPVLSAPLSQVSIAGNDSETAKAELLYTKSALTQVDVYSSDDLQSWNLFTSNYYRLTETSSDDITSIFNEKPAQYFRLLKVDYNASPHPGGPESLAGGTLKLMFDGIFDIDVTIDSTGADGEWKRSDGASGGTLEGIDYTQRSTPYFDYAAIRFEGLIPNSEFVFSMGLNFSFDTSASGRFSGTTNGTPRTVSGTFEWVPPASP